MLGIPLAAPMPVFLLLGLHIYLHPIDDVERHDGVMAFSSVSVVTSFFMSKRCVRGCDLALARFGATHAYT
jgi:hypothetical protein